MLHPLYVTRTQYHHQSNAKVAFSTTDLLH
jgi:hypothetical protein